jgi:hypothetical protein
MKHSKVHIGKQLSDSFPIQNGLKQGGALSPLLFNFALEYAIRKAHALEYATRKAQENQAGLKLNGTHQLLAYADDMNLLGNDIDTVNRNTETLIDASKEVGLEVNVEKTKYMLVFRDQSADRNRNIKIETLFENVTVRVLGNDSNNQNLIQAEIRRRLNSGNACYH